MEYLTGLLDKLSFSRPPEPCGICLRLVPKEGVKARPAVFYAGLDLDAITSMVEKDDQLFEFVDRDHPVVLHTFLQTLFTTEQLRNPKKLPVEFRSDIPIHNVLRILEPDMELLEKFFEAHPQFQLVIPAKGTRNECYEWDENSFPMLSARLKAFTGESSKLQPFLDLFQNYDLISEEDRQVISVDVNAVDDIRSHFRRQKD